MKRYLCVWAVLAMLAGCGGGGGSTPPPEISDFGVVINSAMSAGLKANAAAAMVVARAGKDLSGTCASPNFVDCPVFGLPDGTDSSTGEIVSKVWAIDYLDDCTETLIEEGTCFLDGAGTTFIMPTLIAAPAQCSTTPTTEGHYVNFGIDPCFFDAMTAQIGNYEQCRATQGTSVDISPAVPWFASWGLPQAVTFSGYCTSSGGMLWTVIDGAGGDGQFFISVDASWLYVGRKDMTEHKLLFFGTGSPAYYASIGEEGGVSIVAYETDLDANGDALTTSFETLQVRDQGANQYIERMKAGATHIWYERWDTADFPATPAQLTEALANNPSENRCVQIGAEIDGSKYVPFADCMTAFDKASQAELNDDDWYGLKLIDGETALSIAFEPLVDNTSSTCL